MNVAAPPLKLLLCEPQNLLRRTVTSVARELRIAAIDEVTSVGAAERQLDRARFDGIVIALDEDGEAVALLERLRGGAFMTAPATSVIVMASECDEPTVARMRALAVRRILLKPFKVKGVLESISGLVGA